MVDRHFTERRKAEELENTALALDEKGAKGVCMPQPACNLSISDNADGPVFFWAGAGLILGPGT